MNAGSPAPQLETLSLDEARRVRMTIACRDADEIPKVARAGDVFDHNGQSVQMMHNGIIVEEGCYYGPWMTEIIRSLRGHHEPQEEVVFHHIIERLAASATRPTMVELGSFWAYYSLWFRHAMPGGRVVAMEPDPVYLEVGRRNFALNGLSDDATFVHGALGDRPGQPMKFTAESTGQPVTVVQHDLRSLMAGTGVDRIDLLLADVQGAEEVLLARAGEDLAAGRVRFLIVSTHHHSISGDPLTHQRALARLFAAGAHVIAEHSVSESFSGDGLIAVSFDGRDRDLTVAVSHARSKDSLFGELEVDLDAERGRALAAEQRAAALEARLAAVQDDLRAAKREQLAARQELAAIQRTMLWRWSRSIQAALSGGQAQHTPP